MATKYPILDIPNEIRKIDETTPMLLRENFEEIQRALSKLQVYLNETGIRGGRMNSSLVEIIDEKGNTKFLGDGIRAYDFNGVLRGHFGYYEALAALLAAFTRPSTAFDEYGVSYASGATRYPYAALPGPVWQDLFDADQLTAEYTSGGDVVGTPAVSGGVLTYTGGTQATLLKNNLLQQDCDIIINTDQAQDGGIVTRYQDANNYYLLALSDDSGASPASNLTLYKRVSGTLTSLATANVAWTRGTSKSAKLTLHGSRLEAWFDGVKVISVIDTAFTGGGVGLRNHSAIASRYLDFKVYYAQQGVTVEEGTTNLLTANQASVETDTTGFAAGGQDLSAGAVIARDTVEHWNGSASLKVTTNGTSAYQGAHIDWTGTAISTATTFSAYFKAPAGTPIGIVIWDVTNSTRPSPYIVYFTASGVWERKSITFTPTAATTSLQLEFGLSNSTASLSFYVDGCQLENKGYTTSWQLPGTARATEVPTVPNAGVFTKGSWTVKLKFTPKDKQDVTYNMLWVNYIDGINFYAIVIDTTGHIYARTNTGGVVKTITDTNVVVLDSAYHITFSGDGSNLRLCVNGAQIGVDTAYTEPVGVLPANMNVGFNTGTSYPANGILSDFAVLNIAETLAQHQADYATGLPLSVTEYTTYLMSCAGNLQPTVRGFGLWSKNGRFILQDPLTGQGIEVWDGAVRKVLIGRLDDGSIGQEIVGGTLYSSLFRTGAKTDTAYIELVPPNMLRVIYANKKCVEIVSGGTTGNISIYDNDVEYVRLTGNYSISGTVHAGLTSQNSRPLALVGPNNKMTFDTSGQITASPSSVDKYFFVHGKIGADGVKDSVNETINYGKRSVYTMESPNVWFVDKGIGTLNNGECKIVVDSMLSEVIESKSDITPWIIQVTPYADIDIFVAEIGDGYFVIKERDSGQSSYQFAWEVSMIRKGYAGVRMEEFDPEGDILTSNWEDGLL